MSPSMVAILMKPPLLAGCRASRVSRCFSIWDFVYRESRESERRRLWGEGGGVSYC